MKNKIAANVLTVLTILSVLLASIPFTYADSNEINISSVEDFIAFSKQCSLDTMSEGKTVNLLCDIDFGGKKFTPVPLFCGSFNGNGYTVSGIKLNVKGSNMGLFRYISENGKVMNLNVKGEIIPDGSKCFVGGICGQNSGVIENCSFSGTVKGKDDVGGICGSNTDSGKILSCTVSGSVNGENFTGGISGKNSGFIQNSTNIASVNTTYEEQKKDISDIETDRGAIIENYKNTKEETEEDSILGNSDVGGIAGYSSGILQGCVNNAPVGYKHIGYNVGGIAGRQAGYILGCENYGFIQGRKDVGGIVGQAEPYILLNASEINLNDLKNELNRLNTMVNQFITDADDLGNDTENNLKEISKYSKEARVSTENLLNIGTDFADGNLDEINAQTAILSNTLKKLVPVFEALEQGGKDLTGAFDSVSSALDDMDDFLSDSTVEREEIKTAVEKIKNGEKSLNRALSEFSSAIVSLENAININNTAKVKKAVSDVVDSINDIIAAKQSIRASVEEIETILNENPESLKDAADNAKAVADKLKFIKDNIDTTITSLQMISDCFAVIMNNTEIDFTEFSDAIRSTELSINFLIDATKQISQGVTDLTDIFSELSVGENGFLSKLSNSFKQLSWAIEDIGEALSDMKAIVSDLSEEKPLEFIKLGDDFKSASESLFDSLAGISDGIEGLESNFSEKSSNLTGSLHSVSNQFNLVLNLLISEGEEIKNSAEDTSSDIFLDVSDEDIENARQGKVDDCKNFGTVEADRNTGGIAGAMAIEYAKDPEDDIEKPKTLNFTYRTKAVLYSCVNDGTITGKKDCAGGIVGLSEIGTVYNCENYGDAESTNGDYVGAIAGKSDSSIRKSYAKSEVSGKRYVGGIAGKGGAVTGCYAIAVVSGDENIGAVCGYSDNLDKLYKNGFVGDDLGAVDGISYHGKAEPIDFDTLKDISQIPSRLISFTVSFIADSSVVDTQSLKYGEETEKIKYPKVPEKDGFFGRWNKPEAEFVKEDMKIICEYKPYITILSSNEKNEKGKLSLALAEGEFTDEAKLIVNKSDITPPVKMTDSIAVYDISLINTDISDNEDVTLRIINENKDKVTAWVFDGDDWTEVNTGRKGKYVILSVKGTQNTVCLKYEEGGIGFLIPLAAIMVVAGLAFLFIKKLKSKKQKLKQNATKE